MDVVLGDETASEHHAEEERESEYVGGRMGGVNMAEIATSQLCCRISGHPGEKNTIQNNTALASSNRDLLSGDFPLGISRRNGSKNAGPNNWRSDRHPV